MGNIIIYISKSKKKYLQYFGPFDFADSVFAVYFDSFDFTDSLIDACFDYNGPKSIKFIPHYI